MPPRSDTVGHEPGEAKKLTLLVYNELKALARMYLGGERGYQTLQPTALVHEAYLRLCKSDRMNWQGKTHFLAVATTQMRRILVDRARAASAQKRGGPRRRITLGNFMAVTQNSCDELLALDQSLTRLGKRNPRQCRVAEFRLFSEMRIDEISEVLGVSPRTVNQDWRMARAWLAHDLQSP